MNPDYKTYSDDLLLQKLASDDQDAFTEIYDRYFLLVFETAYNILRHTLNAEDTAQEIFLSLWKRRREISVQSLGGYLNQSAWYFAIRTYNKQKKDGQFRERLQHISSEISQEDPTLSKEFSAILEKIISGLPPDELAILRYSREHHMKYTEIAGHLNISIKKVERKISQSLKRIKVQLGNWLLFLGLLVAINFFCFF